jgi:hypothetical protein
MALTFENSGLGIHKPGGLANCEERTYEWLVVDEVTNHCSQNVDGNKTFVPCRFSKFGKCADGRVCQGPADCTHLPNTYCNRVLKTCSSRCPCGDRSCPAFLDDEIPSLGDPVTLKDSWLKRAVKKGNTCGCTPAIYTEACTNYAVLGVKGALPECCKNTQPEAPVPHIKMNKKEWDAFNEKNGYQKRYGTCPRGRQCIPADPRGCLEAHILNQKYLCPSICTL